MNRTITLLAFAVVPLGAFAQSSLLTVTAPADRNRAMVANTTDQAVRSYAQRLEALTGEARTRRARNAGRAVERTLLPPVRVELSPTVPGTRQRFAGDVTLSFETTGVRAFPSDYRDFLESVYAKAKPFMNAVFGPPADGGTVRVANYEDDIGDRDAVAGGYYLPDNGSGSPEIRFPVYLNQEAAAVNFIHTLLLAYQGSRPYGFDAFQEGLVRAAVMQIVRNPSATTGLDADFLDLVLANTYDVGAYYDWDNQRALGARQFIAPNLKNGSLPPGGTNGGIYLMRFLMAGSAWQKVLAEYPNFISAFNQAYYAQPVLRNDAKGLVALGQTVLNGLRPADPTIEGLSFADWYARQFALQTRTTAGPKLHVAAQPLLSGLTKADFGVFDVQATFFSTDANGNETLGRATAYPIFWRPTFDRLFTAEQDDRLEIVAGYGSVTPNFPDDNAGLPYRVSIDVPVQDQLARVTVPAGTIRTGRMDATNDFFGTIQGANETAEVQLQVRATVNGTVVGTLDVEDGAFGTLINTPLWNGTRSVLIQVLRVQSGGSTVIYSRRVNKGPGGLGVDLQIGGVGSVTVPGALAKGISMIGFPIDPFASYAPEVAGLPASDLLSARWNPQTYRYELFPDHEPWQIGHAYFVRVPAEKALTVSGKVVPDGIAYSVALRPGWNMVSNPLRDAVATGRVVVTKSTNFPLAFSDAQGTEIGLDFFTFLRGANDPSTGAPETGSYNAASVFAPGVGTWVRCLVPEGVTLTFFPPSASPSRATVSRPRNGHSYRLRFKVAGAGNASSVILAMAPGATNGFDNLFDSALPPAIGGLQASAASGWYRDVRADGSYARYTVHVNGMRSGQTYTVTLNEDLRKAKRVEVSRDGGAPQIVSGTGSLRFTARNPSTTFKIEVIR